MLFQNRLDRGPISFRRWNDTTRSQQRLSDESRDGVGALAFDQCFETLRALRGEVGFGLVQVRAVKIIRRVRVEHVGQRQVKFFYGTAPAP